jgi:hypothetical protein
MTVTVTVTVGASCLGRLAYAAIRPWNLAFSHVAAPQRQSFKLSEVAACGSGALRLSQPGSQSQIARSLNSRGPGRPRHNTGTFRKGP